MDFREYICKISQMSITFIGSGISRRYSNAPNWYELIGRLADQCEISKNNLQREHQLIRREFSKERLADTDYNINTHLASIIHD